MCDDLSRPGPVSPAADHNQQQAILTPQTGRLALMAAKVYVTFFNFSRGPVMGGLLGEMFHVRSRGSGPGVSGFARWIDNFGITMNFPIMVAGPG